MKAKYIVLISALSIIIGALLYRGVFPCKENTIIETDTVYVHTVSYDTIIQPKPVPYKVTEVQIINDTTYLYHAVDTAAILADYYSTRYYADTLKDDNEGFVYLTESVSQNTLFDRMLYFESRCTDKIITNTISNTGFYAVGGIGGNKTGLNLSMGILYQNKKQRLYGAEIGYFYKPYLKVNYGIKF